MSFHHYQRIKYSIVDDEFLTDIDRLDLMSYDDFCDLLREKFGEDYIPHFVQYPGAEERERLDNVLRQI